MNLFDALKELNQRLLLFFERPDVLGFYQRAVFLSKWRIIFTKIYRNSLLRYPLLIVLEIILALTIIKRRRRAAINESAILCFAPTHNNINTLQTILSLLHLEGSYLFLNILKYDKTPQSAPLLTCFFYGDVFSILFTFHKLFWKNVLLLSEHELKNERIILEYLIAPYHLLAHYHAAKAVNPTSIWVANNQLPNTMALEVVANFLGKPYLYAQHAQITRITPAMRVNFLLTEGNKSLSIFKQITEEHGLNFESKVIYMGNYSTIGKTLPVRLPFKGKPIRIGVSLSSTSPSTILTRIDSELRLSGFDVEQIYYRPHPGTKSEFFETNGSLQFILADKLSFSPEQYASAIDLHIAGNSSMHVNMLTLGIPSVQYLPMDKMKDDYYGFIADDLIPAVGSLSELSYEKLELFRNEDWVEKMRSYNANYLVEEEKIKARLLEGLSSILSRD